MRCKSVRVVLVEIALHYIFLDPEGKVEFVMHNKCNYYEFDEKYYTFAIHIDAPSAISRVSRSCACWLSSSGFAAGEDALATWKTVEDEFVVAAVAAMHERTCLNLSFTACVLGA